MISEGYSLLKEDLMEPVHPTVLLTTGSAASALASAHTDELITFKIERLTAEVNLDRVRAAERHGEITHTIERQAAQTARDFSEIRLQNLAEGDRTRTLLHMNQIDALRGECSEAKRNLAAVYAAQNIPSTPTG